MNIQLTAELDFLDDGTGHGNVLINHHLNIHNSPLGFREEGRKRISFTGNNCQMCFLIDSTTITLTHSIFSQAPEFIFSPKPQSQLSPFFVLSGSIFLCLPITIFFCSSKVCTHPWPAFARKIIQIQARGHHLEN